MANNILFKEFFKRAAIYDLVLGVSSITLGILVPLPFVGPMLVVAGCIAMGVFVASTTAYYETKRNA